MHKTINHRKHQEFFPKIDKYFRPKKQLQINKLELEAEEINLLNRAGCDITSIPIIENKYVVTAPKDILNIMGAYYESINAPRYTNIGSGIKNIVDKEIKTLKEKCSSDSSAISNFSLDNPSYALTQIPDSIRFFTPYQIEKNPQKTTQ